MTETRPKVRLIARLDVKGPNVVKGIRFEGLRIMGNPGEMALRYYEQGADELLYIDTVASLYGRNNLCSVVEEAASRIFIPMTVGGGIRSVEDAKALLCSGADKVAVNTAAVKRPELLKEIAAALGSQAVVLSLHAKRQSPGHWEAYVDNGREPTRLDAFDWAKKAESLGAGEILATSVDQDGTCAGFDVEFIEKLLETVRIPVIAAGGAGSAEDIAALIKRCAVDAVSVASILHYKKTSVGQIKSLLEDSGVNR